MKKKKPVTYLRSYRRRWGLSQVELAALLGLKDAGVISRIEKKQRAPSLKVVIGCFIIFGTRAAELFPGITKSIEAEVMARVRDQYDELQGDPSKGTRAKLDLFEDAIERAEQRKPSSRP
jgi:transcriptional regulator with XRE-family HTH domain